MSDTMGRAPNLQRLLDEMAKEFDISPEFDAASNHPYTCKCKICLDWWLAMGPDPDDGKHGPFSDDEIADAIRGRKEATQ